MAKNLLTKQNWASIAVIISQLSFLVATAGILFLDNNLLQKIAFVVAIFLFGLTILSILIENKLRLTS